MSVVTHEMGTEIEEKRCKIIIKNLVNTSNSRFSLILSPSASCRSLHSTVSKNVRFVVGTFDLVLTNAVDTEEVIVKEKEENSLLTIGFREQTKNFVEIRERPEVAVEILHPSMERENEAIKPNSVPEPPPFAPTANDVGSTTTQRRMALTSTDSNTENGETSKADVCATEMTLLKKTKLIGLVNQAMTCYLNSLIQTLYMTPEFRNALYRWECGSPNDPSTSIPYQLQHLFLLLQTSDKQSVETTGLTRSFGWDSSEAWQQHDIQELCRVMFDALEKKFEGTDQADLIKQLYEGTMMDYVQCCECTHKSAREDTFLDIPVNIKQANKSYKSVMEGLTAFVEPETLDESNQYYCEKCKKKCDALKGLKFTKFPYMLTLQLKRFDFDYNTMHRIKLNDRMTFPQILNLNKFIEKEEAAASEVDSVNDDAEEIAASGDEDANSHDSGHDFEQTSIVNSGSGDGFPPNQRNSSEEEEGSSVDEGIGIESQNTSSRKKRKNSSTWWMNNEQEEIDCFLKEGPYVYELFSVMVHSGSAAGGHYYAYIKSFENNQWFSFNDQIVSPITHLDIEKTFGGSPYARSSTYYSSFSSSTNAYMLMYRQINSSKNKAFMKTNDLPPHIVKLLERKQEEERINQISIEQERNKCSIRLFCRHHSLLKHLVRTSVEENFSFQKDTMLADAVVQAHKCLKLNPDVVPVECCRLIKYDNINDVLDRSYDLDTDDAKHTLAHLLGGAKTTYLFELLLETRESGETFQRYERGGVTVKVFEANQEQMCFNTPLLIRAIETQTVGDLKAAISERIGYARDRMLVAYEKYSGECVLLQYDKRTLKEEGFFRSAKVFVDSMTDEEIATASKFHLDFQLENTFLFTILDRMANVISVTITLPPEASGGDFPSNPNYECASESAPPKTTDDNIPSSSSSDEGVGSLGGGSGIGGSSPPRIEDIGNKDTPCYPPELSKDEGIPTKLEIDLTPNEMKGFWKIPETSSGDYEAGSNEEARKSVRRRNNSYEEEDSNEDPPDYYSSLPDKLQERLEGFTTSASPTSSLKCEDGNSSHSGQNSLITDMDFEADDLPASEEVMNELPLDGATQPLPAGSEGSSLSTSCSTLDSTDTLCNPVDQTHDTNLVASTKSACRDLPPQYASLYPNTEAVVNDAGKKSVEVIAPSTTRQVEALQAEPCSIESAKPAKCYPGRAVSCNQRLENDTFSDYSKALQYVDGAVPAGGVRQNTSCNNVLMNAAGTGDPSDSAAETEKSNFDNEAAIITSEPNKSVAWDDKVSVASQCSACGTNDNVKYENKPMVNLCTSPSVCANCGSTAHFSGVDENHFSAADPDSFQFSESNDPTSDPESGEGVDKLKPLSSDPSAIQNTASPTYSTDNLNQSSAFDGTNPGNRRERTVSASSITSDGWGVSSDVIQKHNYFKVCTSAESSSTAESGGPLTTRVLSVELDKRMTLFGLKRHLAPIIRTPTRRFCIYKQYSGGQEVEMSTPTDTFKLVNDGANFTVKLGRALRRDEYRCKLYELALDEEETAKPFMSWVIQHGMRMEDAKSILASDMAEQCGIQVDPERIRVRKKTWRSPGQVFLPSDVFGTDISLYGSLEFFIQFLDEPEKKKHRNDLVLLCRRWSPEKLQFSNYHEVILNDEKECISYLGYTVQHLRARLAEISDIPEEHLFVAKGRGVFPYRTSVLRADTDLDWVPSPRSSYWNHLSEDGVVVFYKDNREVLKAVTEDERKEIEDEEQKFDSTFSSSNTSSPSKPSYRREKALKIYTVDTTRAPAKTKEATTEL